MKRLLAVLLAAVLVISGCAAVPVSDSRAAVRSLSADAGRASGVVLSPGLVLTAAHVADSEALVTTEKGTHGIVLAKGDGKLDLALLWFPTAQAQCPCVKLAERDAAIDEPVYVVGYPMGIAKVLTVGASQGIHDVTISGAWGMSTRLGRRLVMTAPATNGNSGGGVFVFRAGEFQLVGILVQGHRNLTFAIPLSDIKPFLAAHL